MINDNCGPIDDYSTIRRSRSATWTATGTELVELEVFNYRSGPYTINLESRVDNLRLYPESASLSVEPFELSAAVAGSATFDIDCGAAFAGKDYLILMGVTGTYPGFTMNGLHIPLNLDSMTWITFSLTSTPALVNFMGTLDGAGTAWAELNTFGPVPAAVGLALFFNCWVLATSGGPPVEFVTNPGYLLFIP